MTREEGTPRQMKVTTEETTGHEGTILADSW